MLNQERLLKVITDMSESVAYLEECTQMLIHMEKDKTKVFIAFGLKQIFVDFFITVEDFISMMLKELKAFKIGIDMRNSLEILKEQNILEEELYLFLNQARLLRNRIAHRYKEPSNEELLGFIQENQAKFHKVINLIKGYIA